MASKEPTPHEVALSSFYLARTEVTNAQYALYVEANPGVAEAVPTLGTALAFFGWSTLALAMSATFVLGPPVLVAMGLLRRLRAMMRCPSTCPG